VFLQPLDSVHLFAVLLSAEHLCVYVCVWVCVCVCVCVCVTASVVTDMKRRRSVIKL